MTGRSDLVKKIAETSLLRYARSPLGWIRLVASGRTLREEEQVQRKRIDDALEGRGAERLAGLSDLVRTVVELRAIGARRCLSFPLRAWLPIHVVTFALALGLLVIHVVAVGGGLRR